MTERRRSWWARGQLSLLALLAAVVLAQAATVTVTWVNPTTRSDGSALTDLDHVTIYWGRCATTHPPTLAATVLSSGPVSPSLNAGYAINVSTPQPVCFELTATDTSGLTSEPSMIVVWDTQAPLGQPVQLN